MSVGDHIGLPCPDCGGKTWVRDSRPTSMINGWSVSSGIAVAIRRRRVCECGFKLKTYEVPDEMIFTPKQRAFVTATIASLDRTRASLAAMLIAPPPNPTEGDEADG